MNIDEMYKAGLHFGFSRTRRHPSMKPFIKTNLNGTDIIDLDKTKTQIDAAVDFLKSVSGGAKPILFVGVKPEAKQIIREIALSLNAPYVADRFVGGTLTNFHQTKKRVEKLHDLLKQKENGELSVYTKKEQLLIQEDINRLDRKFGGLSNMPVMPAAVVMVDVKAEDMCVKEANLMRVPIVGIANTDCNLLNIDYPIVANDASATSIRAILEYIKKQLS